MVSAKSSQWFAQPSKTRLRLTALITGILCYLLFYLIMRWCGYIQPESALRITSEPPGAAVSINGTDYCGPPFNAPPCGPNFGRTPFTMDYRFNTGQESFDLNICLRLAGYEDAERSVTLKRGRDLTVAIKLQKK
jgi:hypothetical protein